MLPTAAERELVFIAMRPEDSGPHRHDRGHEPAIRGTPRAHCACDYGLLRQSTL